MDARGARVSAEIALGEPPSDFKKFDFSTFPVAQWRATSRLNLEQNSSFILSLVFIPFIRFVFQSLSSDYWSFILLFINVYDIKWCPQCEPASDDRQRYWNWIKPAAARVEFLQLRTTKKKHIELTLGEFKSFFLLLSIVRESAAVAALIVKSRRVAEIESRWDL